MTKRFLRNKVDGFIYDYNEILAAHPKCEEVTEEQAFPERFKPTRGRKAALDLSTKDIPEPPLFTIEGIEKDASKGL